MNFGLDTDAFALVQQRVLPIFGEINDDTYIQCRNALKYFESCGSPDIEVHIDSKGGYHKAGKMIASLLNMYKGKKTGVAMYHAHSMAFLIWQVCDARKVFDYTTLHPHKVATTFSKRKTSDVLKNIIGGEEEELKKYKRQFRFLKKADKEIASFLARKSSLTPKKALKLLGKDEDLPVKKAVKLGFVDEVIPSF